MLRIETSYFGCRRPLPTDTPQAEVQPAAEESQATGSQDKPAEDQAETKEVKEAEAEKDDKVDKAGDHWWAIEDKHVSKDTVALASCFTISYIVFFASEMFLFSEMS